MANDAVEPKEAEQGQKPISYEAVVNGKVVKFKRHLSTSQGAQLIAAVRKAQTEAGDTLANIPALQVLIESWEFPGDPADAASYDGDNGPEFFSDRMGATSPKN
jgi:hypothetical protein